jgi:putative transposon-encoded protein
MAYLEIVSVLVLLVSRFDFVIPEQTLVFEPSITLFASSGVFVIPKPIKN